MSGAVECHRLDFLAEATPSALSAWHALGKGPMPEPDSLDHGELREIEAVRRGEREWRYDR